MKKLLFFIPILLLADIDPFNAGNVNSSNPYGLTPTEKAIVKNKNEILKNKNQINKLKKEIKKVKSDLTAKLVMYDEIINDLKDKTASMNTLINEIDNLNSRITSIEKKVSILENNLDNNLSSLNEKYIKLNQKYEKLKESIDAIVNIQNENFKYLTDTIQNLITQIKNQNISPKEAFKKAKELYFNNKLNKAKELFLISLNNSYLPATSSFYLGEIAYKQKKYKEALAFYKKSVNLYPKKTSFTAKLLYHSGIAFERLGKIQEAKLTFKKLIHDFPNSKYSTFAKRELEKLQ
jgi:TolA-binding protein